MRVARICDSATKKITNEITLQYTLQYDILFTRAIIAAVCESAIVIMGKTRLLQTTRGPPETDKGEAEGFSQHSNRIGDNCEN